MPSNAIKMTEHPLKKLSGNQTWLGNPRTTWRFWSVLICFDGKIIINHLQMVDFLWPKWHLVHWKGGGIRTAKVTTCQVHAAISSPFGLELSIDMQYINIIYMCIYIYVCVCLFVLCVCVWFIHSFIHVVLYLYILLSPLSIILPLLVVCIICKIGLQTWVVPEWSAVVFACLICGSNCFALKWGPHFGSNLKPKRPAEGLWHHTVSAQKLGDKWKEGKRQAAPQNIWSKNDMFTSTFDDKW